MKSQSTFSGVLLAEDRQPNLQELSEMLRSAGYMVHPVSNGRDALHVALASPPELILLDRGSPRTSSCTGCRPRCGGTTRICSRS